MLIDVDTLGLEGSFHHFEPGSSGKEPWETGESIPYLGKTTPLLPLFLIDFYFIFYCTYVKKKKNS